MFAELAMFVVSEKAERDQTLKFASQRSVENRIDRGKKIDELVGWCICAVIVDDVMSQRSIIATYHGSGPTASHSLGIFPR